MSSPPFGFPSWRGRSQSVGSDEEPTEEDLQASALAEARPTVQSQQSQQSHQSSHQSGADARLLSSSVTSGGHQPIRSFIHGSFRDHLAPVDSAQHARSVREDTAELATYQLADKSERNRSPAFLSRKRSLSSRIGRDSPTPDVDFEEFDGDTGGASDTILEVSEPPSPDFVTGYLDNAQEGPSLIAQALQKPRPDNGAKDGADGGSQRPRRPSLKSRGRRTHESSPVSQASEIADDRQHDERTPLLQHESSVGSSRTNGAASDYDLESQKKAKSQGFLDLFGNVRQKTTDKLSHGIRTLRDPATWRGKSLYENVVLPPVVSLPAVFVGLLLNILDALSYGMILFPLGSPIFANLGSAGISIFYVSTIVSQVTFSCGSIFKGGVGSELIEVVPFFHSMAATITSTVGEDQPDAVIATTIVSYAFSSMMTGLVFYLMGRFKFGYIVGFIPRHILIGCIGGVGWFLVATGFEVSARMEGSLDYNLDTLHKLFQADTIPLWITPLSLGIVLFWSQQRVTNKYFLPLFIMAIPAIFYFFVLALDQLDTNTLRGQGWIFESAPADEPWWYFWTLYKFGQVHWGAIVECIPAMLALTFFGILHVPINVPALALQTGEDHADVNNELKLHGISNFLSGCAGSIQNYLVYANSLFFMRSGGNTRLAGFELAFLTFGIMTVGPQLIGFIPVMMVGCLIFDLGFELLLEAIWHPRKKLSWPEYMTVIIIVLIMGTYDFVVGIGVGVLLAFISMIFQTSRVSAVRTTYSGEIVSSTVRRNHSQQHYLHQVGQQIHIIKLAGFLFFGTIVGVEGRIRELISDEEFDRRPIRFLVLDLRQVTGLDYSAGEAFNTISRLLNGKEIRLVLSGIEADSTIGRDLRAVGLGEDDAEVVFLPDLNSALESSENELLKIFYASQEEVKTKKTASTGQLEVPGSDQVVPSLSVLGSSPRRSQLQVAARESLHKMGVSTLTRWQNFGEPVRLMLQIFQDMSQKNEDFWYPAAQFFDRREYAAGTLLFAVGEPAQAFYLLEKGIIRAEYDLPHGQSFHESIVAGTTCGELPFFSETARTATAYAELDCVAWILDRDAWKRLQSEQPAAAHELLRISLKLTAERMSTVPSSTMLMAE